MAHVFRRTLPLAALASAAALGALACGDDGLTATSPAASGSGTLVVQLTDAPFPFDSVKSVDVFVVRIDAKAAGTDADSAEAAKDTADADKGKDGWTTLAEPKAKIDLLTLQNGKTSTLGQTALPAGTYKAFRLIIDPKQSSVTLKSGDTVAVTWPSAGRSGIKIQLDKDVTLGKDSTKTMVVDFDVSQSFVMRGLGMKNGLLFKPVIRATSK
jgi:Domain of unknown function (DUF4382)